MEDSETMKIIFRSLIFNIIYFDFINEIRYIDNLIL